MPWDTNWQSLKDLFRTVGDVERSEIAEFPDGKSRGFGIVRFYNPHDAWQAIGTFFPCLLSSSLKMPTMDISFYWPDRLNGAEINGRVIEVRLDRREQ